MQRWTTKAQTVPTRGQCRHPGLVTIIIKIIPYITTQTATHKVTNISEGEVITDA